MAEAGLRYNRFHVTALCSPTRAALLTGRNNHAVGFGSIGELSSGFPGYTATVPRDCTPLPRILAENGYSTAAYPADRRVPLVGQRLRPGCGVIAGEHHSRPGAPYAAGLDTHPGLGLQVADVVGLRPVRGDQPEGIAVQPVSHRSMPRQPGTAAGRLQQGERARRNARTQGHADQPVAGPL
jgi:hypothetical protein